MKVEGEGVSFTLPGRTRDLLSYLDGSDVPAYCHRAGTVPPPRTGRGSPPKQCLEIQDESEPRQPSGLIDPISALKDGESCNAIQESEPDGGTRC